MKRPSIFIYQFHAAALFEPRVYICIVHPLRISPFSLVPLSISTFLALEPRGVASLERALTPPLGTLFGYVNQYVSVTGFLPITLRTDAAENVPIIMGHERSQ